MYTRDLAPHVTGSDLYTMEAEFVTEHVTICGRLVTPERRLSDLVNSSQESIEIRPINLERDPTAGRFNLTGSHAHVTKAQLLFIVPLLEPERPPVSHNIAWTRTVTRMCWAALGNYNVSGKIHVEPGRDPRLLLRALSQRQFFPFTQATVVPPRGEAQQYNAVLINRSHLEVLALREGA